MTRTERSLTKRALLKDRSESKSGLDKSVRKGGAGTHGWGAMDDKNLALEELDAFDQEELAASSTAAGGERKRGSSVSYSEEEKEQAQTFRASALKSGQNVDLAAIARTSNAVSGQAPLHGSSKDSDSIAGSL